MIVGDYRTIEVSGEGFRTAFDWIRKEEWKTLPAGRYELSEDVYAMIQEYTSKKTEEGRFENHHIYADVQMVIEGKEMMYSSTDSCIVGAGDGYNESGDIEFFGSYSNKASSIFMEAGRVCILFPEDYHMPCMEWGSPMPIRKLVVKVKVR